MWSHLFSVSPGPDVNPSITNYRLRLTFSSWGGAGLAEGAVTPGYLLLPWWRQGQTVLAPVWQGPRLIAGNPVHERRSPGREHPLEVYRRCTGPLHLCGPGRCPFPPALGCAAVVWFMRVTLNLGDAGLGNKSGSQRLRSTYSVVWLLGSTIPSSVEIVTLRPLHR